MKNNYRNILVTGAHRSGTTWTGKMIASAENINYIAEPFNLSFNHIKIPFPYWYYYVSEVNEQNAYYAYIHRNLYCTANSVITNIRKSKSKSWFKSYVLSEYKKFTLPYQLMKDPIALMSAEWLARKFNMKVIVSIRHPAAFVASLKVKNWQFDFNQLMNQEQLMNDKLGPFQEEIEKYTKTQHTWIEQAILLWNILYYVIDQYRRAHNNWYFIRHEDLSIDPLNEFNKIFEFLNIPFTGRVKDNIIKTTSCDSSVNNVQSSLSDSIYRSSKDNIRQWQHRLDEEEIKMIRSRTEMISSKFYKDSDWD